MEELYERLNFKLCLHFSEERFEYASKLKVAMENLRKAGERLGKYELEKKYAIALEDYDKAKAKKAQAQQYRQQVYQSLEVQDLLELQGVNIIKLIIANLIHLTIISYRIFVLLENSRWKKITSRLSREKNLYR